MSTNANQPHRIKFFYLFSIFIAAFIIRAGYLADCMDNPTFEAPIVDSAVYNQLAREFIHSGSLTEEFFYQPFFYPFFLSLFYTVFGYSILKVKLFQALLGAGTCALTYLTGKKLAGYKTGLIAGLIAACYGPLIFFEAELLGAGWAAFWAILLIYLLTEREHKPYLISYFLLGMVMVLSILTRPTFLPYCTAAASWTIWRLLRQYSISGKALIRISLLIIGGLIIAAPVAVTNHHITGNLSILPNSGGLNLHIGNNPDTERTVLIRPGLDWKKLTQQPLMEGAKSPHEANDYFYAKYKEYILSKPLHFIQGLAGKFIKFFNSREIPRNISIYVFREWSPMLALLVWKIKNFGFPFGVLLPFSVIGAFFFYRQRKFQPCLFVALYAGAVILVFSSARYRIPVLPVLFIFAASGALSIYNALQTKYASHLWPAVITAFVSLCAAVIPGPLPEEKIDYAAEMFCGVGEHWKNNKKYDQALLFFNKAILSNPQYAETYYNIGNIYLKNGDYRKAINQFRTCLALRPDYAIVHNNLAIALENINDIPGAIMQYNKAIQIDPNFSDAVCNLGMVLMMTGRHAEALPNFEKAIALHPMNAGYQYQAGLAAIALGEDEAAVRYFSRAAELAPDNASAFFHLAIALDLQGRNAASITMYKKALAINPGYDKARLNLGLALSVAGNHDEAISQLQELITQNSDNAEFHLTLGTIFLKAGQIEFALTSIQTALKLSPDLTPAYYYLGLAYIAAGNTAAANSTVYTLRQFDTRLSAQLEKQIKTKSN